MGKDRYFYLVDEDLETRTATVSASCPPGDYTLRVSLSSADNTELASASAGFFILRAPVVIEPPALTALSVSHGNPAVDVALSPAFDSETLEYRAAVKVERVTIAPTVGDAGATVAYLDGNGVAIADADAKADGQQVDLAAGSNTVKVAVSRDGLTTTYTVTLFRLVSARQAQNDATLSALTLSEGRLSPAFASDTMTYMASVGYTVSRITVTPTTTDSGATPAFLDGSDATLAGTALRPPSPPTLTVCSAPRPLVSRSRQQASTRAQVGNVPAGKRWPSRHRAVRFQPTTNSSSAPSAGRLSASSGTAWTATPSPPVTVVPGICAASAVAAA